jgi:hypothetical protein
MQVLVHLPFFYIKGYRYYKMTRMGSRQNNTRAYRSGDYTHDYTKFSRYDRTYEYTDSYWILSLVVVRLVYIIYSTIDSKNNIFFSEIGAFIIHNENFYKKKVKVFFKNTSSYRGFVRKADRVLVHYIITAPNLLYGLKRCSGTFGSISDLKEGLGH